MIGFDKAYDDLVKAGFANREIRELFKAGNAPDLFSTEPYKAMLESRHTWWVHRLKAGWNRSQIWGAINRYYDVEARSPFEFLRIEYKPVRRVDFKTYREVARKRAIRITKSLYRKDKINKPAFHLLKTKPRQSIDVTLKGKVIRF